MTTDSNDAGQAQSEPAETGPTGNTPQDSPHKTSGKSNGSSPLLAVVLDFFKTTSGQIVGAGVGVVVAAVGGWVSPLGDMVKDWLWQEKIEIGEEISANEKETRELRFILQTKTRAGFSGGTVKVSSPDRSIEFFGDTRFIVAATPGSTKIPEPRVLSIRPLTSGKHFIHVVLDTERGKRFTGKLAVIVAGFDDSPFVGSKANWTGTWRIILNGNAGTMKLTEDANKNLSGTLTYYSGETFTVDSNSWTDGTAFFIMLKNAQHQINISGFPCEVSDSETKWRVLNAKVGILKGLKPIPHPIKLSSIIQRCDQMSEKLAADTGDGAFEAHIRLK